MNARQDDVTVVGAGIVAIACAIRLTTPPKQMWDDTLLRVSPALVAFATLLLLFMSSFILVTEIMKCS
ncbi:MAG: hypothetical protein GY763_07915 [Gammaproteobacteria bacterium]|nr:hypothetical protein [Gammaproteobacteria bacterium]